MKALFAIALVSLSAAAAFAQGKSVAEMSRQIASLGAAKNITASHDAAGGTSRLMLVAENFADADADRARVMAVNFAAGIFFAGDRLAAAPDRIMFSLWVKTRQPRFAADSHLAFVFADEVVDIGPSQYVAKPARQMEYLNYDISRSDLEKAARRDKLILRVGPHEFDMTAAQIKSLADLLLVSDPAWMK